MEDFPVKIVIVCAVMLVALSSFPLISQQTSLHPASATPMQTGQRTMQDARAIVAPPASTAVAVPKRKTSMKRAADEAVVPKANRPAGESVGVQSKRAGARSAGLANHIDHSEP